MTQPLISVIVPTYNNERTLGMALDSILAQTHRSLEVIVVDDASTDGTKAVAQRYAVHDPRVRVIEAPEDPQRFDPTLNRNINAGWSARNAGLAVARGEYLTFQDGDDASLLNRLEIQLSLLKRHDATHLTTSCAPFRNESVGTSHAGPLPEPAMGPARIAALARRAKGLVPTYAPALNRLIPFRYKRLRGLNKLFFGSLEPYPGAGNNPFFRREVAERVRFRPLREREWPSFMGRGADRDFNFKVAETFGNSYYIDVPLYLWRTDRV
jgi:glycosyltransferase involved in cell wall biosynthesis